MPKDPLRASKDEVPPCAQDLKPVIDRSHVRFPSLSPHSALRVRKFVLANVAVLVCAALISGTMLFALSSLPAKTQAYLPHDPITITEFAHFNETNGVVSGDGQPDNPFLISGWRITISNGVGIYIENIENVHFMILDVQINGTADPTGTIIGIQFLFVKNWQIENCIINDTDTGLDFDYCYQGSVQGNDFLGIRSWAADMSQCYSVHFVDNNFLSSNGILGNFWQQSNVVLNEFQSMEMCVSVVDANTLIVKENVARDCGHPLSLSWSTNVEVVNNLYTDCLYGIEFSRTTWSDIRGNIIERAFATGISIMSSSYTITISDNVINGTQTFGGIFIENSWDVNITRNTISNNTIGYGYTGGGVTLGSGCSEMLVYNNSFVDNLPQQAQDNGGAANHWNETYPVGGNYWSDHVGIDEFSGPDQDINGSDGFSDSPKEIDADSFDHYPRMNRVPAPVRPVAAFDADPVLGDVDWPITFDASSSHHPAPTKSITGYKWDFDGDGIFDTSWSPDPVTTHQYLMPGDYTVILEVVDEDGMTDIVTCEITILEGGIIPEFGAVLAPVLAMIVLIAVVLRRRTPVI